MMRVWDEPLAKWRAQWTLGGERMLPQDVMESLQQRERLLVGPFVRSPVDQSIERQ